MNNTGRTSRCSQDIVPWRRRGETQSVLSSPLFVLLLSLSAYQGQPELALTLDTKIDGANSAVYCPTLQLACRISRATATRSGCRDRDRKSCPAAPARRLTDADERERRGRLSGRDGSAVAPESRRSFFAPPPATAFQPTHRCVGIPYM